MGAMMVPSSASEALAMMRAGVVIADPGTTWVDIGVDLAAGAYIGPGTQLEGCTRVAAGLAR